MMKQTVKMFQRGGWFYFSSEKATLLKLNKVGKWMYFFNPDEQERAKELCRKAVEDGIVYESKCTDIETRDMLGAGYQGETGLVCLYLNGDNNENHHRVIKFMLENNMIPRTKSGRLYNRSFKFDLQTLKGKYGDDFVGEIKLADFIDLNTGEFYK